ETAASEGRRIFMASILSRRNPNSRPAGCPGCFADLATCRDSSTCSVREPLLDPAERSVRVEGLHPALEQQVRHGESIRERLIGQVRHRNAAHEGALGRLDAVLRVIDCLALVCGYAQAVRGL